MGLFGNKKQKPITGMFTEDGFTRLNEPTLDDASEELKNQAIEYIVSLSKADKDKFVEGVELIWQGYQAIDPIKTKYQKQVQRNASKAGDTKGDDDLLNDDDLLDTSFLDDDKDNGGKK